MGSSSQLWSCARRARLTITKLLYRTACSPCAEESASSQQGCPGGVLQGTRGILRGMTTSSSKPTRRTAIIVLTGFMGSGKSTVGPLLAERLGWRFLDVDDVIVEETGMPISEFFASYGEAAFREREQATIARLVGAEPGLVLALGGGAIEDAGTRELLLNAPGTLVVHLEVQLATTLERCRGTEHVRPVLADQVNLAARYERRLPLYREAHVTVKVDALTPDDVVAAIATAAGV